MQPTHRYIALDWNLNLTVGSAHLNPRTDLEVQDDLAESHAHEPGLGDVPDDGGWQTEQDDHEVGHRQVDDEVVSDGAHARVAVDRHAHEGVAHQTHREHKCVQTDQHPLVRVGDDVILNHFYIVRVVDAVVVAAVGGDVTAGAAGDVTLRDPQEAHVLGDEVAHGDSVWVWREESLGVQRHRSYQHSVTEDINRLETLTYTLLYKVH